MDSTENREVIYARLHPNAYGFRVNQKYNGTVIKIIVGSGKIEYNINIFVDPNDCMIEFFDGSISVVPPSAIIGTATEEEWIIQKLEI